MSLESALRPAFVRELARAYRRSPVGFWFSRRRHAIAAATARDIFSYRRELAGIPDYEPRPAALEAALAGATVWPVLDVLPPRPMRPALDGEAP